MKITALPESLHVDHSSSIQIFKYSVDSNLNRNMINLTRNTISFLRTGTKELVGNKQTAIIDNSEFVIMQSGKCLMTERISSTDQMYKSILLFFTDEIAIDFLERNRFHLTPSKNLQPFYVFQYDDYINHFVESLEKISSMNLQIQRKILKTKFEEIFMYLTQLHGTDFLSDLLKSTDDTRTRMVGIVESNRLNKLSLQELAFLSNMSLSTFKREFYKYYEETPIKWFQNERLKHTAILLRIQKKRPVDLYEEAGYESFSNFVQAFKRKYGITPKQYQSQE